MKAMARLSAGEGEGLSMLWQTRSFMLTPQMADVLRRIRRPNRPRFHSMPPQAAREAYVAAAETLEPPRAPLTRVQELQVPAADGTPLLARLYAVSRERLPVLLYLHGGGFTIGGLE